jgi:rieske iron-sulfur protein
MCLQALAAAAVSDQMALAGPAEATRGPQVGDIFVLQSDHTRQVTADMLDDWTAPVRTWPQDPTTGIVRDRALFNQILLLRTHAAGTEQSESASVVMAFTAICPHAGCIVSGWQAETRRLRCPCHGSEFDPGAGGAVVGGPSPYPLPMLPVMVKDGLIVVSGPYSAPPGGHTGRTM